MSYEEEQERIRRLFQQVCEEEGEVSEFSDSDEEEPDVCENPLHVTDSEQSDEEAKQHASTSTGDLTKSSKYMVGRNNITKWGRVGASTQVRTRKHNIVTHLPGTKNLGKSAKTPYECYNLLISDTIIGMITEYTNIYIQSIQEKYVNKSRCRQTNTTEIRSFIGLMIIVGTLKGGKLNLKDLFSVDGMGMEVFHTTMSLDRCLFLLRCLRFDDIKTRSERREIDNLAPIRDIMTTFLQNCQAVYSVSEYTTIDEQLVPFRGRCYFRQYLPSKPAKYGIKIQTLCDARTWYTLNMEIYPGKQPEGPYKMSNSAKDVVMRLIEPIAGTGRNVTGDNWFTSFPLVEELLAKNLTYVGTIRKNKPELPPELTVIKDRIQKSTIFAYNNQLTALSYIPRKGKNVLLLSSMHSNSKEIDETTGDDEIPEIIMFYNLTKGGVDIIDKMCATYTVARRCKRWPLTVFFRILDIAGINSQTIYISNNKITNLKRVQFLRDIGYNLVRPQIEKRSSQSSIPRNIRLKAAKMSGKSTPEPAAKSEQRTSGRCTVCPRNADKKTKFFCCSCKKFMCMNHMKQICSECLD